MHTSTKLQQSLPFLPIFVLILFACQPQASTYRKDASLAEGIYIEWELLSNQVSDEPRCRTLFQLENRSKQILGDQGWVIYYNQNVDDVIPGTSTQGIEVSLLSGDFYSFAPKKGFQLPPGETIGIEVDHRAWMIKEDQAPMGLYMVFYEPDGTERSRYPLQNLQVKPFTRPEQLNRFSYDQTPDVTPEWQYEQNARLTLLENSELPLIIPRPLSVILVGDSIKLGPEYSIHFEEGLKNEAAMLSESLQKLLGLSLSVNEGREKEQQERGKGAIQLVMDPRLTQAESYRLELGEEGRITISGADRAGVFYGIQSLLALIPLEALAGRTGRSSLPACVVEDAPRFPYRGMHLDVARNFNPKEAVFKLIDVMAFYKLNTLHLHLTDDEGWRLQSLTLPELTEVGAFRGHTLTDREYLHPAYGSGPEPDPTNGYGSGYYTVKDYQEILRYAHKRHIRVIPEFDFPGHARAAIKAMNARYRRFMEAGDEERAEEYLLADPEDASVYLSAQSFNDNVICVCRESVYRFLETIIDEVLELHREAGVPLSTIHIGGDEVPRGAWLKSPICREFQEQKGKTGGAPELMDYFLARTGDMLQERNLMLSGWEEITLNRDDRGSWVVKELPENPEIPENSENRKSPDYRVYIWDNYTSGNQDIGYRIANAGFQVILCSVTNYYFELSYSKDPKEPGEYWGGFVDTRKAFEYIPFDVFKTIRTTPLGKPYDPEQDFREMVRLDPGAQVHILGLQGCLWSESIFGPESMEYYALPKLLGLAERAWSKQPGWALMEEEEAREFALEADWNLFANALGQRELPRLDRLSGGFAYRLPPPGLQMKEGMLFANAQFPGLSIRYTLDGSEPTLNSRTYEGPVRPDRDHAEGMLHARTFSSRGRGSRTAGIAY
jgi:hexosaminidase